MNSARYLHVARWQSAHHPFLAAMFSITRFPALNARFVPIFSSPNKHQHGLGDQLAVSEARDGIKRNLSVCTTSEIQLMVDQLTLNLIR